MRLVILLALCAGCERAASAGGGGTGRLQVVVTRLERDTVRFEAEAAASPCKAGPSGRAGGALLLQGVAQGNGMLVWLRFDDSLAPGEYGPLSRGDTAAPRGAIVATRYTIGGVAHGFVLDSGALVLERAGSRLTGRVAGGGVELGGVGRTRLDARFERVPHESDSVMCEAEL
ncbi:MAG: hypothetical protein ACREL9_07630 [Gemmatimonadales bacterium]